MDFDFTLASAREDLESASEGRKYPISPVCTVGVISLNTPLVVFLGEPIRQL